jgi:Domain of unknown function (DUF222)/HNH endonuclease
MGLLPSKRMFVPEAPAAARGTADQVPISELADELTQLASPLTAGTCRWLELLGEFDARDGWWEWHGVRSCVEWVSWQCSLDPRSAREHLRVARRLRDLPRTREAFRAGELSYSKVRALTRVADTDSEDELLQLARHATAAQLERMLGAYRRVSADEADHAQRTRYVSYGFDEDGSVRLSAKLPAEDGALVLEALARAQAELREAARSAEAGTVSLENGSAGPLDLRPEPAVATRADAFVAVCERALAEGVSPTPGGERYELVVHADLDALSHDTKGAVHTHNGPALAPATARRLGCDAAVVGSLERGGEVLSVGRRSRTIPAAMRRALSIRDQGCRFPGCDNRRWIDAHHIHHWAQGGETSLDNLVLLCRRHHRLLHEGGYEIERRADGQLAFRHPGGWLIPSSPRPPDGDEGELPEGDGLATGSGERMDLAACVGAVFAAVG